MTLATTEPLRTLETPLGTFAVWWADDAGLRTGWLDDAELPPAALRSNSSRANGATHPDPDATALIDRAAARLRAYFGGERVDFSDLPLPPGPPFHRACWRAAQSIGTGTTIGYGALARRAGSTASAARAVGQAMRRNPVPVIVPCHRVVAADGSIGGFAGNADPASPSVSRKRLLLRHEGVEIGRGDRIHRSRPISDASAPLR